MYRQMLLLGLCFVICGPGCKKSDQQTRSGEPPRSMSSGSMAEAQVGMRAADGLPELGPHERSNIPTCDLYLRFMKCLGTKKVHEFVSKAAGLVQAGIRGLKKRAAVDPAVQEQLSRQCHGQLVQMRDRWKGRTEVQECLDHVRDIPPP